MKIVEIVEVFGDVDSVGVGSVIVLYVYGVL